jgi:hypothetical protein
VKFRSWLQTIISSFIADMLDRSAEARKNYRWVPDLWATGLLAASGVASYADVLYKLFTNIIGAPGVLVPLFILLFVLVWCVFLVSAKDETQSHASIVISTDNKRHLEFKYGQPVRYFAKIGIVLIIVSLPGKVISSTYKIIPLPTIFYGYLVDARTGQPIADARVRVVSADGADITQSTWLSDSEGFYIVRTTKRAYRNDRILVNDANCTTKEYSLPLRRADELPAVQSNKPKVGLRPVFRHVLNCGGGK